MNIYWLHTLNWRMLAVKIFDPLLFKSSLIHIRACRWRRRLPLIFLKSRLKERARERSSMSLVHSNRFILLFWLLSFRSQYRRIPNIFICGLLNMWVNWSKMILKIIWGSCSMRSSWMSCSWPSRLNIVLFLFPVSPRRRIIS